MAAAALGSAAFLHRSGAVAKAARNIDRGYRALKRSSKIVGDALSNNNMTIDDVRLASQRIRNEWKNASKRMEEKPITLRADSPDTLFAFTHAMKTAENSIGTLTDKTMQSEYLIAPARDWYMKQHDNGDINRQRKFMNFIRQVSENTRSKENIAVATRRAHFSEEEREAAKDIVGIMRQNDTEVNRKKAYDFSKKMVDAAQEELHKIENLEKHWGKPSIVDKAISAVTGDKAATVGDLLKVRKKVNKSSFSVGTEKGKTTTNETLDLLEELRQRYKEQGEEFEKRFLALRPDSTALRVNAKGEVYSFLAPGQIKQDALSLGALTLPGKILKLRDLEQANKAPVMSFITNASQDPSLAAMVNKVHADGHKNKSVEGAYVRIMDTVYEMTENGLEKRVSGVRAFSSRFGWAQRMQHQLAGDTGYQASSNPLLNFFDVGQERGHYFGKLGNSLTSRVTKFADEDWRQNVFDRFLKPNQEQLDAFTAASKSQDTDYAVDYLEKARRVQKFLKENNYELSTSALEQLESASTGKAKELYSTVKDSTNEELLDYLLHAQSDGFHNKDLSNLVNRYIHDPINARNAFYLHTDRSHLSVTGGSLVDLLGQDVGHEGMDFWQMLRMETGKEAMLRQAADSKNGYKDVLDTIDNLDLTASQARETRRLAHLAIFQEKTGINTEKSVARSDDEIWDEIRRIENVMNNSTDEVDQAFRREFHDMADENISIFESRAIDTDVFQPEPYNSVIHMKKAVGPLSLIRSANESIKEQSLKPIKDSTELFFKQFAAGRDDMQNVTMATYGPYFMLSRLSDDLNTIGLGFSRDSMGSTAQLAKSALFKRILPIAIGATYAEWLDDTSQEITGTSILGAGANGVANVDLAVRKTLDSFGVTPWLKELKTVNPIMQYWGDKDDFMSYDERKKWYETGYEPMRKAPWWTFGGVQEARGGEIEYWAPSFARRINSDYKDKALYDGYFDKWSHSLLPTPSNPLSPLFAILDPYWLEEKHEDDRPYAVSGPMFAEGTPWGAVLNPTVGAIIKPQKELHEWRLRNGVDIKSALHALNENIKQRARDLSETNLIAIKGDTMTPVRFSAFDAPTEDSKVLSVQYNNDAGGFFKSAGTYGVYDASDDIRGGFSKFKGGSDEANALRSGSDISLKPLVGHALFSNQEYIPNGEIMQDQNGNLGVYRSSSEPMTTRELEEKTDLSLDQSLELDAYINGDDGTLMQLANIVKTFNPKNIIKANNEAIKQRADGDTDDSFDDSQGILTPEKLSHFRPSEGMALLSDPDTVQELIHAGKGADLVRDASTSARLISGIYGYMASEAVGFGVYQDKRLATSSDMTSFARTFWDSAFGGAGGETADIFRRFIPNFQRGLNPLLNDMPDWLPERFRYGDPFAKIRDGEARLPGKGWESLNELHSDQYGRYGAFDRFKILADIAPFSPEYKMWREIAKKTVTDPALKEEMAEIRSRVSQQGRKHDFYNYNVIGKSLDYENVTVSEVLGYGKFRSGSTIYKIAGARVLSNDDENQTAVLSRYLHEGMEVTVAKDSDESYQTNNDADKSTNVAVYIDGENLAEQMITNGDAAKKKSDTSTPAVLGRLSSFQKMIGYASEAVAHMDIPWISDQWLRVRSPLESYQAEQVYGTPYQSWSHPIDTFLAPAWERAIHQTSYVKWAAREAFYYAQDKANSVGRTRRHLALMAHVFTDRGAFIGGALANMISPGSAKLAMPAMRYSSMLATIGHFATGGNSMFDMATSGAGLGMEIARFFKKDRILGGAIGAIAGIAYRAVAGENTGDWIPNRAKKRWALQDYFDRLTYIKYMGLYHEAARRAKEEEDVDVEDLAERAEKRTNFVQQAMKRLTKIKEALRFSNNHITNDEKEKLKKALGQKLKILDNDTTIMEGGKWTHTALIYKQAAESTMYGIDQNSSWAQIITALPKTDKEYFMEFVKERNPDKREEILRFVSPALKKALGLAWGTPLPKRESNKEYFKTHKLPTSNWGGWRPDVDLADVEVKTIENEGMNMSDFGYYESQLRDPNVINAPEIDIHSSDNATSVKNNLKKILQGKGLRNIDINVTANTEVDTHRIVSDIAVYTGSDRLQKMVNNSLDEQS